MYEIIPLSLKVSPERMEELGTKPKFWFRGGKKLRAMFGGEARLLFKADERGTGEDWAEKAACELCGLLGVPHVHYEMARYVKTGAPGVICATCASPERSASLVHGKELLLAIDPDYPADQPKYKTARHTVDAVVDVLENMNPPPNYLRRDLPRGIQSALDVFVGYVMLDAWIANQDRHHENWAGIQHFEEVYLAPTFDHGAALARNITDDEREKRLMTKDANYGIAAYAGRGKSAFNADGNSTRTLTTHAAWRAFAKSAPAAADIWLERLRMVDENMARSVLNDIPPERLSELGRYFTFRLLCENRDRLLEGR